MIGKRRSLAKAILDIVNPYAWATGIRNIAFDAGMIDIYTPTIPTICIGNISVGGTGKTPHTEYLVKLLKTRYRIAVLSRGYGRSSKGYMLAGPDTTMAEIGDEPFQIKMKFPTTTVAVCEKRAEGIRRLMEKERKPQAILLDDAFQHRYVKAGLNILLIDINRPVWLDCVLPFGRLRESIAGMRRADVIIITKCNGVQDDYMEWCRSHLGTKCGAPVFFSRMRYGNIYNIFDNRAEAPEIGNETGLLLVTGIAKPGPMKEELEKRGADVTLMRFADHHNFSHGDINGIVTAFSALKGSDRLIVTTEKDATRLLMRDDIPEELKKRIFALPIEVEFLDNGERMFNQIIENYVTKNSRNC